MDQLLTTRQVIEQLKVDRITVYRMLQDGRLQGVKIGQQWRFSQSAVNRLLGVEPVPASSVPVIGENSFPTHCVQTIQDLFCTVGEISAVTVNMQGEELTQVSRPSMYYQVIQRSPTARLACRKSRSTFATACRNGVRLLTCYSGLQCLAAPIFDRDEQVGAFLAGQFYWQRPDPQEEDARLRRLASVHKLSLTDLKSAAQEIPVISPEQQTMIEAWPISAANAIQSILKERTTFIERLQRIADLTQVR